MSSGYRPLSVRVWGELACFTRPELKAERVSYRVMTPSAARGILESIFWKPEMRWRVEAIHVLKPIRTFSVLRNEVNSKASVQRALSPYLADEDRAQRQTLALRCVDYLIRARIEVAPRVTEDGAKFRDQFRRRVERGQCFITPYLGCREFAASFGPPTGTEVEIEQTEDLGLMLFDLHYDPAAGRSLPVFFPARLDGGILRVPQELYGEVENGAG